MLRYTRDSSPFTLILFELLFFFLNRFFCFVSKIFLPSVMMHVC
jgi:hypothetical protein